MSWVYRRPFDYRPSQRLGHGFRVIAFAAGAMTGTAAMSFGGTPALSGTGALATSTPLTFGGSAIPTSTNPNELIGSVALQITPAGVLPGAGVLASAEPLTFSTSGTLFQTNAYQPSTWAKRRRRDDIPYDYYAWEARRITIFPYSVSTATAGIGSLAISPTGVLTASGILQGSSASAFGATASPQAGGGLAGTGPLVFTPSGTMTGTASGSIAAGQSFTFGATGTLTGAGALYGPSDMAFGATATSVSLVPPSGSASMAFTTTGRLRNASAGAGTVTDIFFATSDGLDIFLNA